MEHLKGNIWNYVKQQVQEIVCEFPEHFKFNHNGEKNFNKNFDIYYDFIKSAVMYNDVQELDRHKLAAIIICAIIKAEALQQITNYDKEGYIFDGNEKIAVNIGMSYMESSLKELLSKRPEEAKKFKEFILPEASMCNTDYISILCRNLCFARKYYDLNPIDLANTLFLVEYTTLIQVGISPAVMKQLCEELAEKKKK